MRDIDDKRQCVYGAAAVTSFLEKGKKVDDDRSLLLLGSVRSNFVQFGGPLPSVLRYKVMVRAGGSSFIVLFYLGKMLFDKQMISL